MIESKVIQIFVIESEGGALLLHIDFRQKDEIIDEKDPTLTSAWLTSVYIYASESTGKLRKIQSKNHNILMLRSKLTMFVIYLKKGEREEQYRNEMFLLQQAFETKYNQQLGSFDGSVSIFREFQFPILQKFPYCKFDGNLIPVLSKHRRVQISSGRAEYCMDLIEKYMNGVKRISDIAELVSQEMAHEEFRAALSIMFHHQYALLMEPLTQTHRVKMVDGSDIYGTQFPTYLIDRALNATFDAHSKEDIETLLDHCDGQMTIEEISKALNADLSVIEYIIKGLVLNGILVFQKISANEISHDLDAFEWSDGDDS